MEENTLNINIQPFEISVLRVGNKQMTISVFNQLYEEKPFDQSYDLVVDLWGKVNRSDSYVIFKSDKGIRKFNTANFNRKIVPNSFSESLIKVFNIKTTSFELGHMRSKLMDFYYEQNDHEKMLYYVIRKISADFPEELTDQDGEVLKRELSGDFKIQVLNEFENGLKRLEKRNRLVDVFAQLPQLFIAV